jgi:hypothetical protein
MSKDEREFLMKIRKLKKALEESNANEKMDEQILGGPGESKTSHLERAAASD